MNSFYLGCDVSKGYADFIIIDQHKQIKEPVFQLDDTFDGHNQLFNILSKFIDSHPDSLLYSAVESTGGLENNWLNMLYRLSEVLNIKAARINPQGPVALHKASLERNGNDAISAKYVAEYLIAYPEKVNYNTEDPYVSLRKQWNLIQMYKKQKTQLLNQLSLHIYTSLPFLVKYCKNGVPNWILQFLLKYNSASKIARAKEKTISNIPYITHKRSQNIIEDAKQSIGSNDDEVTAFIIKSTVEQILNLKKNIEKHRTFMVTHCDLPEVELLTSFPGIGIYSAIGLILNIVSIERFPSAKHLASYFGVHPVYKKSGDNSGSGAYRMSKKGRAVPRNVLFMVARSASILNPLIKEVYIDHLKMGKCKMSALGVCMHKILRIVFGMLKHQSEFNPEIDKRNRNNTRPQEAEKKESEVKRRFQKETDDAPISRRQSRNRKKRKQSQPTSGGVCGIIASPSLLSAS